MNEREMEAWLSEAVWNLSDEDETKVGRVSTYEEVGMLTRNKGLVVKFRNGDEFQVCIVQSKAVKEDEDDDGDEEEGSH